MSEERESVHRPRQTSPRPACGGGCAGKHGHSTRRREGQAPTAAKRCKNTPCSSKAKFNVSQALCIKIFSKTLKIFLGKNLIHLKNGPLSKVKCRGRP